jgi:hypothetical protein
VAGAANNRMRFANFSYSLVPPPSNLLHLVSAFPGKAALQGQKQEYICYFSPLQLDNLGFASSPGFFQK